MTDTWRDEAACAGHSVVFDLASDGDRNLATAARKRWYAASFCHECPVRRECAADALNNREFTIEQVRAGMWFPQNTNLPPRRIGAPQNTKPKPQPTTPLVQQPPRERRRDAAEHGTRGGYARHMRGHAGWTRPACEPCRQAEAAYTATRKRGKTQRTEGAA